MDCQEGHFCPEFNIHLTGRLWQIYKGENISIEDREAYLKLWREQAAANPEEVKKKRDLGGARDLGRPLKGCNCGQ